jgi:LL-diaminopimelate aminotransferase
MAFVNENYLKLQAGYLFPEIARRMESFCKANPQSAKRVIRCGIGDVTEPLPPACIQAMHTAADELGNRDTFRGHPPPTGYEFLRDAIARTDFADRGLDISADEIFVSDGSKGDCGAALDIFGDGNAIGITDPVYPVYVDTNVMVGNTGPARADGSYEGFVYLPGNAANGFVPDLPREKLDIIYLCYPNNPTGAMITRSQLEQWVTYALANNSVILYDVAYQAYIRESGLPRSIYEIPGARECAMEFHSFSKDGGFTGVRCGYTVCPKDLFALTRDGKKIALHGLWSRRWSTKSNGVSYPVQRAAEALYSPDGRAQIKTLIEHYMTNAKILRQGCEAMGMQVFGGVNAPYVWVACPDGLNSWQMFDRMLQEANVVITPGVGFGRCGEGWFRINAFNSRENVEEVVKRMKAMVMQPA